MTTEHPAKAESKFQLDRRQFLKIAGAVALTAAAGGTVTRLVTQKQPDIAAEATRDTAKQQWAMVFDLRRCDGCGHCNQACHKMHYLPKEQEWIKVHELHNAAGQKYFLPTPCMQCENAPCVKVCPVHATYKSPDGVTLIDQNICIGCRMCMAACPYGARYFNWNDPPPAPASLMKPSPEWPVPQQRGTVGKCVFCVHNIRMGKLPACIEACSMEAIYLGDLNADLATNGRETVRFSDFIKSNDAVRLKEELNTKPRVYYITGHGQAINF